jgi:glycosyltransferase involved in cell wall biosynthesis
LVEKRKGNVYARHSAVKHAIGQYLVFCDDDCYVAENWLSEIDRVFKLYPDIGLLGTRIEILWDKTPPKWIKQYQPLLGEISGKVPLSIGCEDFFINSGSMAIASVLFKELKGTLPEQIGDNYVGDGEVGLCRKLHKIKRSIALTNDTYVNHYQIISKNADLHDIRRRFQNNGIGEAFHEIYRLQIDSSSSTDDSIKYCWDRFLKCLLHLDFSNARHNYFWYFFYKKKAEYIKKFSSEILENNSDWILDEHYFAPDLIYSTTFIKLLN